MIDAILYVWQANKNTCITRLPIKSVEISLFVVKMCSLQWFICIKTRWWRTYEGEHVTSWRRVVTSLLRREHMALRLWKDHETVGKMTAGGQWDGARRMKAKWDMVIKDGEDNMCLGVGC